VMVAQPASAASYVQAGLPGEARDGHDGDQMMRTAVGAAQGCVSVAWPRCGASGMA
jgi:hypothetical protein